MLLPPEVARTKANERVNAAWGCKTYICKETNNQLMIGIVFLIIALAMSELGLTVLALIPNPERQVNHGSIPPRSTAFSCFLQNLQPKPDLGCFKQQRPMSLMRCPEFQTPSVVIGNSL